jgi:hypothetical protein
LISVSSLAGANRARRAQTRHVANQNFIIFGAFLDARSGECYHQRRW